MGTEAGDTSRDSINNQPVNPVVIGINVDPHVLELILSQLLSNVGCVANRRKDILGVVMKETTPQMKLTVLTLVLHT